MRKDDPLPSALSVYWPETIQIKLAHYPPSRGREPKLGEAGFGQHKVARPAREVLFTVLSREDKYKAKSFLNTFIYRTGDQIGAWSYPAVGALGLG